MTAIMHRVFTSNRAILLIILLAVLLRSYNLSSNPKSMYGDSLTLVYDAYSILKTGMDQTGEFLPTFFSMGGGRPALYIYATIPFVALWGTTAMAARAVSVLSGIGIVILLYLLCLKLFNKRVAIYAAVLAALTPWELSLSRGAFESHFALFLGLFGLFAFYKATEKTPKWFIISGISFALSMQTYSTYVFTVPFFLFLVFYSAGIKTLKSVLRKEVLICLILVTSSFLFSVYITYSRGSKDRFTNIQVFNQLELQNRLASKINVERAYSQLDPRIVAGFHNRILETFSVVAENYTNNFGLPFLFLQGDGNPRHNPASSGEFFWFCLPLLVMGIFNLHKQNKKLLLFISIWILIAPIAGSLVAGPHALRNSFLLPPLLILCALGVPRSKKIGVFLVILFLIQLPFFINRFYFLSPNLNAKFWSYSAKVASEKVISSRGKFDYIILSANIPDIEFAYPVYAKVEPSELIYQNKHKTYLGEFSFSKFGNVYLGSIPGVAIKEMRKKIPGSLLYLGPIQDIDKLENEGVQRDEDQQPLYVISPK